MLEPYEWKRSRTVLRRESGSNPADLVDYFPLVQHLHGQLIRIASNSEQYVNPMDINFEDNMDENPISTKSDFIISLCEVIVGGKYGLTAEERSVIDRCVRAIYMDFFKNKPSREKMM